MIGMCLQVDEFQKLSTWWVCSSTHSVPAPCLVQGQHPQPSLSLKEEVIKKTVMTPRDALLRYLYLVSADEGLNLSPHKLRHVRKLWNEAMFQKCTLVMLRTGKSHHTKWPSQVLFRVHGEYSGASFVAVQLGTRNPRYYAMSRLFLTLAQARFLNWVLQERV